MDEKLKGLVARYNENSSNFITTEIMKIFYESQDENIKLQALELLIEIG